MKTVLVLTGMELNELIIVPLNPLLLLYLLFSIIKANLNFLPHRGARSGDE